MARTEVYGWRVEPRIRRALQHEARQQGRSVAAVLNDIAKQWLETRKRQNGYDEAEQARIRAAVLKCVGTISGGDPHGSDKVRETVRKRLKERYGR